MESSPLNSVMAGILPAFRKPSETCQKYACRNALQIPAPPAGTKCLVANPLFMRSDAFVAAWRASRGRIYGWQVDLSKDFSCAFVFPADAVAYPWPGFLRRQPYNPSGHLDPGDRGRRQVARKRRTAGFGKLFREKTSAEILVCMRPKAEFAVGWKHARYRQQFWK